MISGQAGILAAIVIYLLAMVYVGFYFSKKGSGDSADDFYLGGRKLGPFVTAMSAEASDMSSWLLMGLPGVAYLTGIADAGWTAIGLGIGTYLNWLIVAQRLRRYSIVCNAITIPDFFSRRFKDDKNILMCISAIIILVFFIPYTASGFKAIGTLFSSLFGTDRWCSCYRRLYRYGRLHGSFHYRPDPERGYVHFPGRHRILWHPYGRWLERSCKQRYFSSRLPLHDPAS